MLSETNSWRISIRSVQPFWTSPWVLALISMMTANTQLTHALTLSLVLIPLCYGELSLTISSWYSSPLFLYDPSDSYLQLQFFSIGIIFSNLFSLHTLAWACVLQFKLSIMLVSLISQPCLHIFQSYFRYYLSYVSSASLGIYKLKLLHKLTTEHTLHNSIKPFIIQTLGCCFS